MWSFIRSIFGFDKLDEARIGRNAAAQAAEAERAQRIAAVRVITGDVAHRYVILDTVRGIGFYEADGREPIDPEESTRRANDVIQESAAILGADAVIHAQYHILRYTVQRRGNVVTPVYETHVFGTAIKIVAPPPSE